MWIYIWRFRWLTFTKEIFYDVKLGQKKTVNYLKISIGKECVFCEVRSKAKERVYNLNITIEHNRIQTCFLRIGKKWIKTEWKHQKVCALWTFPNLLSLVAYCFSYVQKVRLHLYNHNCIGHLLTLLERLTCIVFNLITFLFFTMWILLPEIIIIIIIIFITCNWVDTLWQGSFYVLHYICTDYEGWLPESSGMEGYMWSV